MALGALGYYKQGHGTRLYLKPIKAWSKAKTNILSKLMQKNYAINVFNLNPDSIDYSNSFGWSLKEEAGKARKQVAKWKQFDARENSQTIKLQGLAYPYAFDLFSNGLAGINESTNLLEEQNSILEFLQELTLLAQNGTHFEALEPTKEQGTKSLGTMFIANLDYSKKAFIKDSDCLKLPYTITLERVN